MTLISPLNHGHRGVTRERAERWIEHVFRRIYFNQAPGMDRLRDPLRRLHSAWKNRLSTTMRRIVDQALDDHPAEVILLSAYLQHRAVVEYVAECALHRGTAVLLGGPAFSDTRTVAEWVDIPGVTAVFAGEADTAIVSVVKTLLRKIEQNDFTLQAGLNGVSKVSRRADNIAPPLENLENLPVPDFDDFPWQRYPHRIIPVMATRGCSWGLCVFCSDVTSANGRGFRTRPLKHVLNELEVQAERYDSRDFIFSDIRLNSDIGLWHGLIQQIPSRLPGARWIATVHVEARKDNGLDAATLRCAHAAGLTRVSFGLESGSQRLLRLMSKGTSTRSNSRFIHDAHAAGISVRVTMIVGYPGETAADLQVTNEYLAAHEGKIDRIHLSRFKPIPGTRFERMRERGSSRIAGFTLADWDFRYARADGRLDIASERAYREQLAKLLRRVHDFNRRPLRDTAAQFDGLM